MMKQRLLDLNLPPLLPRQQMLSILLSQEYGHLPDAPVDLAFQADALPAPTSAAKQPSPGSPPAAP